MIPPMQPPNFNAPPPWANESNRVDVNLIAMLLWQALLTGVAVAISHMDWYLPNASPGEMGLQYGLIAFGFLCASMVLFQVGGVRDSLAMRAEFSQESRYDKWFRQQMQMQARRAQKSQYYKDMQNQMGINGEQVFGVPNVQNTQYPEEKTE
tara:strand:+ start:3480 stop:3935 length:456 start_codon:yes stop_codon:yes gene_type:complete